jgi:CheY-like chemotaxis protein
MARALTIDLAHIDRAVIKLTLERLGVEVLEAASGEHGVQLSREHEIDVAFVEASLAEQSGGQLIRRVKRSSNGARVVAITSWADHDIRLRFRHAGAADVLERPLSPARVRTAAALAAPTDVTCAA